MNKIARNLLEDISMDHVSGASQLAWKCLEGLVECVEFMPADSTKDLLRQIAALGRELGDCRPSMPIIANQLRRLIYRLDSMQLQPLSTVRASVSEICRDLMDEHSSNIRKTLANMLGLIAEGETIMTHSHSSLVAKLFLEAAIRQIRVVVAESRPGGEGQYLAKWLLDRQIPVTLVSDSQSLLAMEYVDRVVVGADCVATDGSVINKVGTHPLALFCAATQIPLFVVADTLKYSDRDACDIPLERIASSGPDATLQEMEMENRWFEITPAHLISAWVNERGLRYEWRD